MVRSLFLSFLLAGCALESGDSPAPRAEVLFPDVGQGHATVVAVDGKCVLIDAGPFDTAPAWVSRLPCASLEAVLVTHWDLDHRGGLDSVLARLPVGVLCYGHSPAEDSVKARLDGFCRQAARGCLKVSSGQNLSTLPGIAWTVLSTGADSLPDGNGTSVVSRVSDASGSLLVAGDLDSLGEQSLATALGSSALRSDLLLLSHHGSAGSNSLAWLGAVRPSLAVAQAGRGNRYGHPASPVLARLLALGIPAWSTLELGGARMRLDGSERSGF